MQFRNRLQYFLVKRLAISNQQAKDLILSKKVLINNIVVSENIEFFETDEVLYENEILQTAKVYKYFLLNKPRGFETTLNPSIKENICNLLPQNDLFPIGRLDKESEGLLLLTNNGNIMNKIISEQNHQEKEYVVEVDKNIPEQFYQACLNGIPVLGKLGYAKRIEKLTDVKFKIVLEQGLNKQIRRMCKYFDLQVIFLQRTRIMNLKLENLNPAQHKEIIGEDLNEFLKLCKF